MTLLRVNRGTGHSYTADGVKLPGVTTILQQSPKTALIDWAGRTTAEYALDHWDDLAAQRPSQRLKALNGARFTDRDTAARKGTQVHKIAEQLVVGAAVDVPEALAGHVDSYLQFLDHFSPEPIAVELVICNRAVGYCGTTDLVCHMLGQTWMLDLKTARSGQLYRETALQVCAYARAETFTIAGEDGAETPLADLGIDRCGAVSVRADGYDLRPLDTGPEVWDYFGHLAWLHHHDEASQGWIGEAIEPAGVAS